MFDDLSGYFHENILASYQQYAEAAKNNEAGLNNDLRLALHAATALYHFREHIPKPHQKTRQQLTTDCADYELLGDIVDVAKHRTLRNTNRHVIAAEAISEVIVLTQYEDEDGPYFIGSKAIDVHLQNGARRDLSEILNNVLNMWFTELHRLGVLKEHHQFCPTNKDIPTRRSESGAAQTDLEMRRGVRWNLAWRLQQYNYETGQAEPMRDVESATFKVYKPSPRLDASINVMRDGITKRIKRSVPVTDEEYTYFLSLTNEDEQRAFVFNLAQTHELFNDFDQEWEESQDIVES
jgi:hypothetical protein